MGEDDTLIVTRIDRTARSLGDLKRISSKDSQRPRLAVSIIEYFLNVFRTHRTGLLASQRIP